MRLWFKNRDQRGVEADVDLRGPQPPETPTPPTEPTGDATTADTTTDVTTERPAEVTGSADDRQMRDKLGELLGGDADRIADAQARLNDPNASEFEKQAARTVLRANEQRADAQSAEGDGTLLRVRTKEPPKKTRKVYKLMRLGEDSKLYPLFIDSASPVELGTWYDADSPNLDFLKTLTAGVHLVNAETGESMTLEQFSSEHPELKIRGSNPNAAAIDWATANGMRWMKVVSKDRGQRRYGGELRSYYNYGINGSGAVETYALRPGWHAGSLPTMRQIGKGPNKNLRDNRFVWVEGEVAADVDYQGEADANPDKDIPDRIPEDGYYLKATNADKAKSQADRVGWFVSGAFKANRIISDAEARRVIDQWNAEHPDQKVEYDYEREGGVEFSEADAARVNGGEKATAENYEGLTIKSALGRNSSGEIAPSLVNSGAKLDNASDIHKGLDNISAKITQTGSLGGHELLYGIAQAFGFKGANLDHSKYFDIGHGAQLRVADHYGSVDKHNRRGRTTDNYGFVIKFSNSRFRSDPNVDYLEDGYYLKATNADKAKSQADRVGWFVSGAFKANRIISDAEARRVIDQWNAEHPDQKVEYDYEREGGVEFSEADAARVNGGEKATTIERGDAVSGNPSDGGLRQGGSEHLSHNPLTHQEDAAKIQRNTDITLRAARKIQNEGGLKKQIATASQAVSAIGKGLHLDKSDSSQSYYGDVYEGDIMVDRRLLHLRVSDHEANGARMGNADADHKVSLVIRKNGEHVSTGEHDGYTEWVFEPSEVSPKDAANAIIGGVVSLIRTGEFVDATGKAHRHNYPYTDNNGVVHYRVRRAPNGEESRLDERLYDEVRTGNFKKWFGDWENNPEEASKVVDANGEPLVVYHQTNRKQYINQLTACVCGCVMVLVADPLTTRQTTRLLWRRHGGGWRASMRRSLSGRLRGLSSRRMVAARVPRPMVTAGQRINSNSRYLGRGHISSSTINSSLST